MWRHPLGVERRRSVWSSCLQRRGRVRWGLFQCSEHPCNDVVACVIISPWGSPSLCKQAELMSPSGVEDKDRRPHDSLTVDNRLSHPLISFIRHNQSSLMLSSWSHMMEIRRACKWSKNTYKPEKWQNMCEMDVKVKAIQKHTQLRLWKCVQIHNPSHDATLIDNPADDVLMSSRYYCSHVSREHWSTAAVIDYRTRQINFMLQVWFNDGMISLLKQKKPILVLVLFIKDQCVSRIDQANETTASTVHPQQGSKLSHWDQLTWKDYHKMFWKTFPYKENQSWTHAVKFCNAVFEFIQYNQTSRKLHLYFSFTYISFYIIFRWDTFRGAEPGGPICLLSEAPHLALVSKWMSIFTSLIWEWSWTNLLGMKRENKKGHHESELQEQQFAIRK